MVSCPKCGEDEDLNVVRKLEGTVRVIRCGRCGHEWQRGEEPVRVEPGATKDQRLLAKFPTADGVPAERLADLDARAKSFSHELLSEDLAFRERFQRALSQEQLPTLTADDFREFYRSRRISYLGQALVSINTQFLERGEDDYIRDVREALAYLLYGSKGSLESRLTDLIDGRGRVGVPGIKESVLMKVLAVTMPHKIFPWATYDSPAGGKRQVAKKVLALQLPPRDATDWTIGRLAIWSSDLFAEVTRRWWDELAIGVNFVWRLWEDPNFPES